MCACRSFVSGAPESRGAIVAENLIDPELVEMGAPIAHRLLIADAPGVIVLRVSAAIGCG